MSPAHVGEPTYQRLKEALMGGRWPGGTRLEALKLAEEFGVSMTPVRDSLNHLVGEGFVELVPGQGFSVVGPTEQSLREMLKVNQSLLTFAVLEKWTRPDEHRAVQSAAGYPERLVVALSMLASGSGNTFLTQLIDSISDRLHCVRLLEPLVLPNAEGLVEQIEASLSDDTAERLRAIDDYHTLCRNHVTELIKALRS